MRDMFAKIIYNRPISPNAVVLGAIGIRLIILRVFLHQKIVQLFELRRRIDITYITGHFDDLRPQVLVLIESFSHHKINIYGQVRLLC